MNNYEQQFERKLPDAMYERAGILSAAVDFLCAVVPTPQVREVVSTLPMAEVAVHSAVEPQSQNISVEVNTAPTKIKPFVRVESATPQSIATSGLAETSEMTALGDSARHTIDQVFDKSEVGGPTRVG